MSGTGPGRFDDTLLLQGLPADLWQLLARAAAPARLALVGGAVRDLLLHREHRDPWRGLMDLDLVVDADASALSASPAEQLLATLKGSRALQVRSAIPHGRFGTVAIELQVSGQELLLDLASARQERYPQPAANPSVRFGRLEEDLARRDFSINAMALVLDPEGGEPQLLDPHGGRDDLQRRQLRVLHADSFRDDPTRTLRAARYAARLGFRLAPASLDQLQRTLAAWPWPWRAGDPPAQAPPALSTRLRMELELLLDREPWTLALTCLQAWGGLALLDPQLQRDRHWRRRLLWAERFGLSRLTALIAHAADPLALGQRLQLPHGQRSLLREWLTLRGRLQAAEVATLAGAADWTLWLERTGASPAAVALALVMATGPRRPLLRWWLRWRHLRAPLSAAELMTRESLRPGPLLGERLRALRLQRLRAERC